MAAARGENALGAPPPEDAEDHGGVEAAAVASEDPSPSEDSPDIGKITCSVIYLCFYGFMTSVRPGEAFITPNLLSSEKNFTREQVTNEITPVLTYSYMAVLVPIFLLTDLLRYKPVLIIQGICHVVIWIFMLQGTSMLHMQFMEFFYGITMACRVAYSSYIFSLVDPVLYQRVAGYSRSSVLLGVFTSSVLGQLCVSVGNVTFYTLDAICLGFVSFGLLLALCLPWPKRSLFFNRTKNQEERKELTASAQSELDKIHPKEVGLASASSWKDSVFVQMLLEVKNVVKRPNLRLWSLWCGNFLHSRLRQDSVEHLVRVRDRYYHGHPGGPAAPHGHHGQHLGLLRLLYPLQGLLPVLGADRHLPDCLVAHKGAVCSGVWHQHLLGNSAEEHHQPDIRRQEGPGPGCAVAVPGVLHLLDVPHRGVPRLCRRGARPPLQEPAGGGRSRSQPPGHGAQRRVRKL
ncbi:reduced folate transporter isoform X2 [Kryptolebias marmoratus]|uniref:reduced folate transporter isoform X2 n=1 Tax=Kryptolebias marmoratus TaxID=37003 RepID=UPI0007F91BB0|nr:reduced folate transporter isoform X2 [Kryptolebias marmoratus]